jgi:hypothetical protein
VKYSWAGRKTLNNQSLLLLLWVCTLKGVTGMTQSQHSSPLWGWAGRSRPRSLLLEALALEAVTWSSSSSLVTTIPGSVRESTRTLTDPGLARATRSPNLLGVVPWTSPSGSALAQSQDGIDNVNRFWILSLSFPIIRYCHQSWAKYGHSCIHIYSHHLQNNNLVSNNTRILLFTNWSEFIFPI